jgi:diacylglycerol kinase family enzyme
LRWARVLATPLARDLGLSSLACFTGEAQGDLSRNLDAWIAAELARGATNFLACGGDGTLNLALNALMRLDESARSRIKLGAIGLGSSNDFHKPNQAPERSEIAGRPARLAFDRARPHDVGCARFPQGKRYFAINASVGVTAEANDFFNHGGGGLQMLKKSWVDGAIVASALITFARYRNLLLELDFGADNSRKTLLTNLGVIKNRHFSGSFRYDQGPGPDDGLFGIHVCEKMSRGEMLKALTGLARGRFSGLKKTSSIQAPFAEVHSAADQPFAVETDGEVTRTTGVRFEILPKGISLCP